MPTDNSPKTLRTTIASIAILKQLEAVDGARVSEIAGRMDKPKSTIHGHLVTLEQEQFVVKEGGFYSIDPELLRLGNQVRTWEPTFVLTRQSTKRLFGGTRFRSIFIVEMGGKIVFLYAASGDKMEWSHEQLGNRLFLRDTAIGKTILTKLPEPRIKQIPDRWGLPQETESTATDREALFEELKRVREQGYAVNRAENFSGLYAVGAAATRRSGNVIGGFSVTGPVHSVTGRDRKAEFVHTAKDIVSEFELGLTLA